MVTCFSSTVDGSAESSGANDNDLAKFSTKELLVEVCRQKVRNRGLDVHQGLPHSLWHSSLATSGQADSRRAPYLVRSQAVSRPLMLDGFPFDEGALALRGERTPR